MSTRPPLSAQVALERDGVVWLEAETLRYDESDIVLSVPEDAVAPGAVPVPVVLVWTTGNGLLRVEAEVRQEAGECRVRPLADADLTQRREYARLPMGTSMRLSHRDGTCAATLVDISEAALRVRIDAEATARLHPDDDVRVTFTLHRTPFMLRGSVLREQDGDAPGAVDVIVLLDIPAQTANDLRRNAAFARAAREQHRRDVTP